MIIEGNDPYTQASFSLSNRMQRILWKVSYLLLFRFTPRPFHAWRSTMLRLFGAQIGKDVHVYPQVDIWAPWNLKIGDKVGIANGVTLYSMDRIEIGNYCVISQGSHLCAGSHDYNSQNFQLFTKPIVVRDHAWICAEAFISLGVTIPEGAVVGARAVVTKTLEDPWAVYAGNPCKRIKARKNNTCL